MGLVLNHKFMRVDTKSFEVVLMLRLPHTKNSVKLKKTPALSLSY